MDIYKEFADGILHGWSKQFDFISLLMLNRHKKGRKSKEWWSQVYEIFGFTTESEICEFRNGLVQVLADRICNQKTTRHGDEMNVDHYFRYIHALDILEAPIPLTEEASNARYRIAYLVWKANTYDERDFLAWEISEALKK